MNAILAAYARQWLKDALADRCTETHREVFARMYSHQDTSKPVNAIVDAMPTGRLDWAMTQVQRTIEQPTDH